MRTRTHRPLAALATAALLITACGSDDERESTSADSLAPEIAASTIAESDVTAPPVENEATTVPTAESEVTTPAELSAADHSWKLDGDGSAAAGELELEFVGAHMLSDEAVSFDGHTGHAISSAPGPIDTTQSFTVTAWVNYAAPSEIAAAVSQLADTTGAFQLGIGETSQWWFMMKTADQTGLDNAAWAEGATTSPSSRWVHLAGVHDADEGVIRLFVDGELAGETPFSTPVATSGPMTIGRAQFDATPGNFWPGAIADVGIYRAVLTANQIAELHVTTAPAGSPPAQPAPDPSTYADGILNGTWDYMVDTSDTELTEFLIDGFSLTDPDEIRIRIGFDDHEFWQGFVIDGELIREPGGVPAGAGGTFVINGEELRTTGNGWDTYQEWKLDGDQLTLTVLVQCNLEHTPPLCVDTRDEIIEMDPFVILVTEHTYTKSGDDPSY